MIEMIEAGEMSESMRTPIRISARRAHNECAVSSCFAAHATPSTRGFSFYFYFYYPRTITGHCAHHGGKGL